MLEMRRSGGAGGPGRPGGGTDNATVSLAVLKFRKYIWRGIISAAMLVGGYVMCAASIEINIPVNFFFGLPEPDYSPDPLRVIVFNVGLILILIGIVTMPAAFIAAWWTRRSSRSKEESS